jgi:prevent-host-death family protein
MRGNMDTISATNFRKNIFNLLSDTITYNTPLQITTKEGAAVVLSAEDYSALQETLFISSVPGLRDAIIEGLHTPLDECLDEEAVEW